MKSCFDGYLTPACATCEEWQDGSNPYKGIGCGAHWPIMDCPHFAAMYKEEESKNNLFMEEK